MICMLKAIYKKSRNAYYKIDYRIKFFINNVNYEKNILINGKLYIHGNNIKIGNGVTLNSSMKSNPIGGDTKLILLTNGNGSIEIGNGCGISNTTIISSSRITIGNNVLIGGGCKVYDTDFHSIQYEERIKDDDEYVATKPIIIADGAFIGAHSIILKGTTIGEESIIGAGSVVSGKSIPEGEIWAGNPACFIRKINL